MATLYKHGELGQIDRLDYRLAYCAYGQIMRNDGEGWKLWKRFKAGFNPKDGFERAKQHYAEKLASLPAFAAWRAAVHEFPLKQRGIVTNAVQLLHDDPDGCWSELDDWASMMGGYQPSFEEVQDLCRLYKAAHEEGRQFELARKTNAAAPVPVTA